MDPTAKLWRLFVSVANEVRTSDWYYCRFSDARWTRCEYAGLKFHIQLSPLRASAVRSGVQRRVTVIAPKWTYSAEVTDDDYKIVGNEEDFRCAATVLRLAFSESRS